MTAYKIRIDTVECYSTLRKPTFPLFVSPGFVLQHLRKSQSAHRSPPGFRFLRDKPHGRSLLKIMERTSDLLENYDMFLHDPGLGVDLWNVIAARRVLQYQALCTESCGDPLYTLCRLGLLVFLIESLELLPPVLPYHEYASRQLMLTIDECDRLGYWEVQPKLMLWATVLGGLTSRERPLRWWFAEQLRGGPIPANEFNWKEVQEASEQFLPFKYGQGHGCERVWKEACAWLSGNLQTPIRAHASSELAMRPNLSKHASLQRAIQGATQASTEPR